MFFISICVKSVLTPSPNPDKLLAICTLSMIDQLNDLLSKAVYVAGNILLVAPSHGRVVGCAYCSVYALCTTECTAAHSLGFYIRIEHPRPAISTDVYICLFLLIATYLEGVLEREQIGLFLYLGESLV